MKSRAASSCTLFCAVAIPFVLAVPGAAASSPEGDRSREPHLELFDQGRYAEAGASAERRIKELRRTFPAGHPDIAAALGDRADCLLALGEGAGAETLFREALELRMPSAGDAPDIGRFRHGMAHALLMNGRLREAEEACREALEFRARILGPRHRETLASLRLLGSIRYTRGDVEEGEALLREAVTALEEAGDSRELVEAWTALGDLRREVGDFVEAEGLLGRALQAVERSRGPEHPEIAFILFQLALTAQNRGDFSRAEELQRRVLNIHRRFLAPEHPIVLDATVRLGALMTGGGTTIDVRERIATAEAILREVEPVCRRVFGDGSPRHGAVLCELGFNLVMQWKDLEEADALLNRSVEILRSHQEDSPQVSRILNYTARLAYALGDYERAEAVLADLEQRYRREQGPTSRRYMSVLEGLGLMRGAQGDFESAREYLDVAGRLWEMQRLRSGSGHVRASFYYSPYERLAGTQLETGRETEAWESIERLHSLTMAEILLSMDRRRLTAAEQASEDSLALVLSDLENRLPRLREIGDRDPAAREEAETLHRQLLRTEVDWDLFQSEMGRRYPGTDGRAYPLDRIQSILDDHTAIVSWLDPEFGFERPSAWGYVIRNRGPVRWERLPIHLSPDSTASWWSRGMAAWLTEPATSMLAPEEFPAPDTTEREMWDIRLAPLLRHLDGVGRLVVIPSRAMTGVPVEALRGPDGTPLLERFLVSYAPSSTIYAWLLERKKREDGAGRGLLVGDPPFQESHLAELFDPAQEVAATRGAPVDPAVFRGALSGDRAALGTLPRLWWSRREIEAVAGLLPGSDRLLGKAASETELVRRAGAGRLSEYGVLHFATHAVVSGDRVDESALILAQVGRPVGGEDSGAGRATDGLVTAAEIVREWDLDAEIVTLSACRSATGLMTAEGAFGLAQAFLISGARSILASLWPVDDEATALLMGRFYENWLERDASKAAALAEAKEWLRALEDEDGRTRFAHPWFWAGFVLIGS